MNLAPRGRGRPKSKKREHDEASRTQFNSGVCSKLPGLYSELWLAIATKQRRGFEQWAAAWCSSVILPNSQNANDLWCNPLFRIVDGVCASNNKKWYRATERQFMFQVADVAIVMHCILSFVSQAQEGKDISSITRRLSSPAQFIKWAANHTGECIGDVLSSGDSSVLNFRRVMQDGVLFHARHCRGCKKLNKSHTQLDFDMRTFAQGRLWVEPHTINIHVQADGSVEYECGGVCAVLCDASSMWPAGVTNAKLASLAHIVSSALNPMERGKIVKHIVGRLKTLIGHNNTIPAALLMLQNPTLTHDKQKRSRGCGPMLWSDMLRDNGDDHMKMQRKKKKASLCSSVNDSGGSVASLVWGMFASPLNVRITSASGMEELEETNFPIVELHQDAQFYDACAREHAIKSKTFECDRLALLSIGVDLSQCSMDCTVLEIDSSYHAMIQAAGTEMWVERCRLSDCCINLGSGIRMAYQKDIHRQMQLFRSLSLPHLHSTMLTSSRPCNMKDPDKFGYSWCPRKKRKRISMPVDTTPASACSFCGKKPAMPVTCSSRGQCCLVCLWAEDIGYFHKGCLHTGKCFNFAGPPGADGPKYHAGISYHDHDATWTVLPTACNGGSDLSRSSFKHTDVVQEIWQPVNSFRVTENGDHIEYTSAKYGACCRKPLSVQSLAAFDPVTQEQESAGSAAALLEAGASGAYLMVREDSYLVLASHITSSSAYDIHDLLSRHKHYRAINRIFGCHFGSKLHLVCLACIVEEQSRGGDVSELFEGWECEDPTLSGIDDDLLDLLA